MLRKRLPGVKVKSAGVHGLVHLVYVTAWQMLPLIMAYLLKDMPDERLLPEMARNYDLILAEWSSDILLRLPQSSPEVRGKTMLFGQWLEQKEIPDPYRKSQDAFTCLRYVGVCQSGMGEAPQPVI
ncbi:protein tyrosine phosphatase [Escherichia coli]